MDKFHNKTFPRLRKTDPAVSDSVLLFGVFNLVLGAGLFSELAHALDFFIINEVTTSQFWGLTFFLSGLGLLLAHWFNRWNIIKGFLLFCLFLKLVWLCALSARQIEELGTNIFLIMMFTALAGQQLSTYMRFPRYKV